MIIQPAEAVLSHAAPPPPPSVRIKAVVRWLWFMMVLWGIPSFLLWWTCGMYVQMHRQYLARQCFESLETGLTALSDRCQTSTYFREKLDTFFSEVKGVAARPDMLNRIVDGFRSTYPDQAIDVFLFNGTGSILPIGPAEKGIELFFKHVSIPWTTPIKVPAEELHLMTRCLPTPEPLIKAMKGRSGRLLELGGAQRFSWGYAVRVDGVTEKCVGGMLVFLHQRYLKQTQIFDAALSAPGSTTTMGYLLDGAPSRLPTSLAHIPVSEIERLFRLSSENRCRLEQHLLVFQRLDQTTLLLATMPAPHVSGGYLWGLALLYVCGSFLILTSSFRMLVLGRKYWVSIRWKLILLILLAFGFPWLGAAILAALVMEESREEFLDRVMQRNYHRLAELDEGFSLDLIHRNQEFRRILASFRTATPDLDSIREQANELFDRGDIDNFHLVSSGSALVLTQSSTPAELRKWFQLPLPERLSIFESLTERGAAFPEADIRHFVSSQPFPLAVGSVEPGSFHDMLLQLVKQAGLLAIEQHNADHGIALPGRKSARDLAMETVVNDESGGMLKQVRTHLGRLLLLHGGRERASVFIDVLPGPGGEGWYGAVIVNGLVGMSRHFLQPLFEDREAGGERTLHLRPDEHVRAASLHHRTVNFPNNREYQTFQHDMDRFAQSPRPQSWFMEFEQRPCLVSGFQCSFLPNYVLFFIIPEEQLHRDFAREIRPIWNWLAGLAVFGILAGALLSYRFLAPVWDLSHGVQSMRGGNYQFRLPLRSQDEFGELAASFNQAIQHLEEMALAMPLQRDLLPRQALRVGRFSLAGRNEMTQAIGGDYFDFIPLRQGKMAVILGDVSGHGVSAALVTAMAKAAFSILAPRFPDNPVEVMARVNASLHSQLRKAKMMTCFMGILDPAAGSFTAVNAGQCYPIHAAKGQAAAFLPLPSTPLGIRSKLLCTPREIDLNGTWLLLYSDGLVEANDRDQRQFGYDRLLETMRGIMAKPTKDPMQELLTKLREFTQETPWSDDVTLVLIRTED